MRRATETCFFVLGLLLLASVGTARATDIWDQPTTKDDTAADTRNVLLPGDIQRHDVQAKAGPTADQDWYRLVAVQGHSYEVRVGARQDSCFDFVGNKFEILESDAMTQRTTGVDILGAGQISSYRAVFIAPISDTIFVHLTGETTCTATSEYTIQLFDTTLLSPRWSTFGGFFTSYGFLNTTSLPISGTLILVDGTGIQVGTQDFTIPAGAIAFTDTLQMGLAANNAGRAIFRHNGPAGGITADAFIQNFSISPPVIQPVKFERAM